MEEAELKKPSLRKRTQAKIGNVYAVKGAAQSVRRLTALRMTLSI